MRYREDIPPEMLAENASNDMFLFTIILGLIIGIILTGLAWYGRQWWLVFWAGGLILISIGYLIAMAIGYI